MTDVIAAVDTDAVPRREPVRPSAGGVDGDLVAELVEQARASGLQWTGDGGLLQQLTKRVLEAALEGEITDHLGYDKGDPAGNNGGNSRNGVRTKTVLTEVGPVELEVPHSAGVFDHGQHVHPGAVERDGLEEVAGEQRVGLGGQESSPGGGRAVGCGFNAGTVKDLPDR